MYVSFSSLGSSPAHLALSSFWLLYNSKLDNDGGALSPHSDFHSSLILNYYIFSVCLYIYTHTHEHMPLHAWKLVLLLPCVPVIELRFPGLVVTS